MSLQWSDVSDSSKEKIIAGATKSGEIAKQRFLEQRRQYSLSPKTCENCGAELEFDKKRHKFCSRSCAAIYNNKRRGRLGNTFIVCNYCGKKFTGGANRKYCSTQCSHDMKKTISIEAWKNGGKIPERPTIRWMLRKENAYYCSRCGASSWLGEELILQVHHKNGDWQDDSPSNIEILCPNCHSITDTYGGKNRGNGRDLGSEERTRRKT